MVTTRERPIIFSGPMVCAILDGRKTQTRRIAPVRDINFKSIGDDVLTWGVHFAKPVKGVLSSYSGGTFSEHRARSIIAAQWCQYGAPGDRLWVRETWGDCSPGADALVGTKWDKPWYRADADTYGLLGHDGEGAVYVEDVKWRPSIHMPRSASRITLEVTAVRIERLNDISEADALAEGVQCESYIDYRRATTEDGHPLHSHAVDLFHLLWESLHGPGSWAANPLVWVIGFKRITE